jgi:hypothetical protein
MRRLLDLRFRLLLPLLAIASLAFALWGWTVQARALGLTPSDIFFRAVGSLAMSNNLDERAFFNDDWRVDLARVLGGLAFVLAASQAVARLLSARVGRYMGRFRRGHLLVVGDDPVARSVVEAAVRRAAPVTWIANGPEPLTLPGALILPERWDRSLAAGVAAAGASRAVVAFADQVEQIAAVRDLRAEAPALPITMNFADTWFAERMDELENISGVRFVSQIGLAVRGLHRRQPPFRIAQRLGHERLHALIFGFGHTGEAVLTDLLLSSLTGFLGKPRMTIVDPRAVEIAASLAQRCPGLGDSADIGFIDPGRPLDVRLLPAAALAQTVAALPVSLAYVCIHSDIRTVALAVSLQALARREGWAIGPIFTRTTTRGALPEHRLGTGSPEAAGLVAFGATEDFSADAGLFDPDSDALPRLFHAAYRAAAPAGAMANRDWDALPEEMRESNRRLLIHLPAKLATAGVDGDVPLIGRPAAALPDLEADPALLERLAALEHARWTMERHLSGWRLGPVRDDDRRLHPGLGPYADLDEGTRDYDRAIVRQTWKALGQVAGTAGGPLSG